jgi:hypothetical protein
MEIEQSIAILKALADKSRLAIMNSLLDQSQYAEDLAKRHALAPSTVSFHLRKLEQAGLISCRREQYYVVIKANEALLDITLRQITAAQPSDQQLQNVRLDAYRRKVLDTFFPDGTLLKLPTQHKKRLIVLAHFAERFEPLCRYSEQEVTRLITPLFGDYCTIRRLLVDEGLLQREGATYWREAATEEQSVQTIMPTTDPKGVKTVNKGDNRAQIKRLYKQSAADMGVYQIRNTVNNRIFLECSKNLEGTRNSRLFQLKMGKIVFNRELQKDLTAFGAGSFEFSVLEVLGPPQPGENVDRLLADLELQWLEKLQPFGERGYNSLKGFQRKNGELPS